MSNRTRIMWILLVVLIGLLVVGEFGTLEVIIWLTLLVAWIIAFFTWRRQGSVKQH